jgi:hypothetical protein
MQPLLEAQAQFEGPERMFHVCIAEHEGNISDGGAC